MADVDSMKWADKAAPVPVEQADREQLSCLYCGPSRFVEGERFRAEPHDVCLARADVHYEMSELD